MILPALPASRAQKPGLLRAHQKKKKPRGTPLLKTAPLLHPTPVIFTVPAGTVKVVSIANGCNVLQPLSAATAVQGARPIPIATLLVNPAPFPCPLNPPLANSPTLPLLVASNSASPPASNLGKDPALSGPPGGQTAAGRDVPDPVMVEPEMEPEGMPGLLSAADGGGGPWPSGLDGKGEAEGPLRSYVEVAEGRGGDILAMAPFSPLAELGEMVQLGLGSGKASSDAAPRSEKPDSGEAALEEDLVLDLGQGLDVELAPEPGKEPKETQSKPNSGQEVEAVQPGGSGAEDENAPAGDASSAVPPAASDSGVSAKLEELAVAGGCPAGVLASQESAGEKESLEEEEEEDFDDYIQDEDDEMSSASEESVLSVPELQETMEKLTWLASERQLSQDGDSEEENSPEENSEPEEEEEEEEEEGEGELLESHQKEDEMAEEVVDPGGRLASSLTLTCSVPEVEPSSRPAGENTKVPVKSRVSHRARAKRGRTRASQDPSKLLLLYDDDILERDPLREQKDLAFAQAYLNRVREALRLVPSKYEEFLHNLYEFERNVQKQTAVDLYARLRNLLHDWPQLLTDFAAFLLPEQALECGLFEEQQAFEKSRTFLRRLEICFAENPSHHQKIIKVLQNCADCVPHEIMELKNQMWQLLRGHDHLQDEFSVFFDHLRPSASRLGDFEEINWTEEKEYEFDGFEEVTLPDMEEEEDPPKIHATPKSRKRKDLGSQNTDKEAEWAEGGKEWCSSCHEHGSDLRLKRSKRRSCGPCANKAGESKGYRNKDPQDLARAQPGKDPPEENGERREEGEITQSRMRAVSRRADSAGGGSRPEGKLPSSKDPPSDGGAPSAGRHTEPGAFLAPPCTRKVVDSASSGPPPQRGGFLPKLHRLKNSSGPVGAGGGGGEARLGERAGETSSVLEDETLSREDRPGPSSPQKLPSRMEEPLVLKGSEGLPPAVAPKPKGREMGSAPTRDPGLKTLETSDGPRTEAKTADPRQAAKDRSPEEQPPPPAPAGVRADRASPRQDDSQQKTIEPTVCAKNIKVSSTGQKVVLWTREADRVILTTCQEQGARPETFGTISQQLPNKTADEVAHRFRELMTLFHTACDDSSEDEDDGMSASNVDQLSDKDPALSEEEPEDQGS